MSERVRASRALRFVCACFDGASQDVSVVRQAGGERRAVVEGEAAQRGSGERASKRPPSRPVAPGLALGQLQLRVERVDLVPERQRLQLLPAGVSARQAAPAARQARPSLPSRFSPPPGSCSPCPRERPPSGRRRGWRRSGGAARAGPCGCCCCSCAPAPGWARGCPGAEWLRLCGKNAGRRERRATTAFPGFLEVASVDFPPFRPERLCGTRAYITPTDEQKEKKKIRTSHHQSP